MRQNRRISSGCWRKVAGVGALAALVSEARPRTAERRTYSSLSLSATFASGTTTYLGVDEERQNFREWKLEAPTRFAAVVRKIIAWDLDRIETETDYVVALWDDASARGGGTAAEITLAYRLGKPVYLVLGMPRERASGWILAAADQVFEDFEGLKSFLRGLRP